ncbi:MAG: hypothetical protein JO240_07280 [Solirubrobacterales bacterium]|nr:hypothetical protein [Solirubrobacterales bacterium]
MTSEAACLGDGAALLAVTSEESLAPPRMADATMTAATAVQATTQPASARSAARGS